jgi:hypothetical protein
MSNRAWRTGGASLSPTRVPGIHQRPTSFGADGLRTSNTW